MATTLNNKCTCLEVATDSSVNAFREVLDIAAVQACHGDSSIRCHVDVCLLGEGSRLRSSQAGETIVITHVGEHKNTSRLHQSVLSKKTYLNMPICDLTWLHSPGVLNWWVNVLYSSSRMVIIRFAMPFTSSNLWGAPFGDKSSAGMTYTGGLTKLLSS
jgi:hypothetical protein